MSWLLPLLLLAPAEPARFEVAAWVDHFDFCRTKDPAGQPIDTETLDGWRKILDHVQETGATSILWRNCGGATMRYQSREDTGHHASLLDPRRGFDTRPVGGWVRYAEAQPDILRGVFQLCRERGLRPGVHWPFEENHWSLWTVGTWNLEHPQYWCRNATGRPWMGRCSIAFPEVMAHKLALLDELIERGMEVLYLDLYRSGGWSPADEYVEPVMAAWRERYGTEPPRDAADVRWARHVAGYVTEFIRQVRQRLDASGRHIDLYVGVDNIAPLGDQNLVYRGADWPTWVDQKLIDGLVIIFVKWDPKDPLNSTRQLGRDVMQRVQGRCKVLWPIRQYDFGNTGYPSLVKAAGRPEADVVRELVKMAWEEGAAGLSLECVDNGNYRPAARQVMRELTAGECRLVRQQP